MEARGEIAEAVERENQVVATKRHNQTTKPPNRPHAMTGGDGQYSYDKNSNYQKNLFEIARPVLNKALSRFSIPLLTISNALHVADLGCSTGKNSIAQTSVLLDCLKAAGKLPADLQIKVSFSDLPENDFNLLFQRVSEAQHENSVPRYLVAAVPGSFYEALFPKESVHVITCNTALHWMSR